MNQKTCKKYAQLITKVGVNIQKGQDVKIMASPNTAQLVEYIVEEAYKLKARKVFVEFTDERITKLGYKYQSQATLNKVEEYEIEKMKYSVDTLPCEIHIMDGDPDIMKGINAKKVANARKARYPIIKPFRDAMDNRQQWVIVAMPSLAWAKKIMPNENDETAFKKLEDAIIKCTRLDQEDPVLAWEKHIKKMQTHARKMNRFHFDSLTYTSKNGTNLKIGLHPKHVWLSARETHLGGIDFCANMPTEEVFTMPDKYRVDGIVHSSKPLSYQGNLIEDFSIRFKKGKATKIKAKVGLEYLEEMINMDEGSSYLGEVALVPFNSPINQTDFMFYNTLFDENACCHLALGMAFKNNIKGYEKMNDLDFATLNYNDSMNHVDFMIGTEDLKIIGTTKDGHEITVFDNGLWAI